MATYDESDDTYDALIEEIDKDAAKAARQRKALGETESGIKRLVVRALKAGIAEERLGVRSEVQRHSGFSAPTVRALADDAGIPPDERYVRKPKVVTAMPPTRESQPRAQPSPPRPALAVPSAEELPDRFRGLPPSLAAEIVVRIRRECPTWHGETRESIADAPPLFHDLLEIKLAQDAGVLDDLGITLP